MTARFTLARTVGGVAAGMSRLTGRGSGTTIGGRVTLLLDPSALRAAAAGRSFALVSGTNGKSTTRTLLAAALSTLEPVVSNSGGANLPTGLTAALCADRLSKIGVLEVDEPFLPAVAGAVGPRAVVLLNLSRDQLDRYAEVRRLAGIWRSAVTAAPFTVVANADDPLVTWAASAASSVVWVAAGQRWTQDSTACPECGEVLQRNGSWHCLGCGLQRPEAAWRVVDGLTVIDPDGGAYTPELSLPGEVNVGNAALAAAAASVWGVRADDAFAAMSAIDSVEGRYLRTTYAGRPLRLLLAKNPAGWGEALRMADPSLPVVVAVNARAADGRDPSWLWDVPFEMLRGRACVATGERARDVAVRLLYAGVEHVRIDAEADALRGVGGGHGPFEVLANYTAFQTLRKVVGDV